MDSDLVFQTPSNRWDKEVEMRERYREMMISRDDIITCTHGRGLQCQATNHEGGAAYFVNDRREEINDTMNRRDRTLSLSPLPTTRRLLPRPQYRNRSLMEWREPDQIIKDQVSC